MPDAKDKIIGFTKLSRPLNLIQAAFAVLVCFILVSSNNITKVIFPLLTVITVTAGGNAINDFFDADTDRINRPNRPIPSGLISKRETLIFSIILFFAGILFTIPILNLYTGLIIFTVIVLLIIYTPFLKNKAVVGNMIVSLVLGSTFIFACSAFNEPKTGIIPGILAFFFNFTREIIKDIEDYIGDKNSQIKTLPVKYGKKTAKYFAISSIILTLGLVPLPYFFGIYGKYYLYTVLLTIEIPVAYVMFSLMKNTSKNNCSKLSTILKYSVFFGLLAILLGKV